MRSQQLLALLSVLTFLCIACVQHDGRLPFSGVYRPSLHFQPDDSAGAFLIKSPRFTSTMQYVMNLTTYQTRNHYDESTIDVLLRGHCATCLNLQTRDFLDYFVEGLSTTVENLGADQRELVNYLSKGLKRTVLALKAVAQAVHVGDKRQERTVAVLVFNSDMTRRVSTRMKVLFFQVTFWSVYRYHKNIKIMVKSNSDLEMVVDMQLAQTGVEVVNLALSLGDRTRDLKYSTVVSLTQGTLIKQSLDRATRSWLTDSAWSAFKYLYFSVGDQLLHARNFPALYDAVDIGAEGNFLLAPHRMQTLPLAQSLPPAVRNAIFPTNDTSASSPSPSQREDAFASSIFSDRSLKSPKAGAKPPPQQWVPGASVFTEDLSLGVQGSCCDHGRILFPDCATQQNRPSQAFLPSGDAEEAPRPAVRDFQDADEGTGKRSQLRYRARPSKPQWAGCTEWGARNFTQWLRVGPDGFAMPPVTVHLAHCSYSPTAELCPLPPSAAATSLGRGPCARMPVPMHVNEGPPGALEGGRGRKVSEKAYLHCSEVASVQRDPQTEYLLSRAVRQSLRQVESKGGW